MVTRQRVFSALACFVAGADLCVVLLSPRLMAQQQNHVDGSAYITEQCSKPKMASRYSRSDSHSRGGVAPVGPGAAGFASTGPRGAPPPVRFSLHRGGSAGNMAHSSFAARGMPRLGSTSNSSLTGLAAEHLKEGDKSPPNLNDPFSEDAAKRTLGFRRSPFTSSHNNTSSMRHIGTARLGTNWQASSLHSHGRSYSHNRLPSSLQEGTPSRILSGGR